jgi:gamma-butyrobetaine dioxygenase
MTVVEAIERLFESGGRTAYFGEPVSQAEHALQAAHLADAAGAPDALVVAALLHDVGHLLYGLPEDVVDRGIDARNEDDGAAWLAGYFGPDVTDPVRLHVAAKRYLCAVDTEYLGRLSPVSLHSLALQGGPFDAAGVAAFEREPFHREAVRLRRWDDAAKAPGLPVPGLDHYRARVAAAVLRREGGV